MKALNAVALVLAAIGAINWGLVALLDLNLVAAVLGDGVLATIVYALVGLAGLYSLALVKKVTTDDVAAHRDRPAADAPRTARAASGPRADHGVVKPHSDAATQSATARDLTGSRSHATAAPGPVEGTGGARPVDAYADVPGDSAIGTTHDPNSVTTGTTAEPDRDVFPPKGRAEERRAS